MAWEWVGQVAPAVGTVGAAAFGLARSQGRLRRRIHHDVELLAKLPEGSTAHADLLDHLEWQVKRLAAEEERGQRQVMSTAWAFAFAGGFGYLAVWSAERSGWEHWLLAPALLMALLLIVVGLQLLSVKLPDDSDKAGLKNS